MKPYRRDHHKQKFPTPDSEDLYSYKTDRKAVFRKKDFHKNEYSNNDERYYERDHGHPS